MRLIFGLPPKLQLRIEKRTDMTDEDLLKIGLPLENLENHFKVPIGNSLPGQIYLDNFTRLLDLIFSQTADDEIVGMHCFHGINRTGYLVVYYLIHRFGMTLQEAIDLFELHRKEIISSDLFLDDLK